MWDRALAERLGVEAGDLIHPSRVALTGQIAQRRHFRGHGTHGRAPDRGASAQGGAGVAAGSADPGTGVTPRRSCWASLGRYLAGLGGVGAGPGWWPCRCCRGSGSTPRCRAGGMAVLRSPVSSPWLLIVLRPLLVLSHPAPEQPHPGGCPLCSSTGSSSSDRQGRAGHRHQQLRRCPGGHSGHDRAVHRGDRVAGAG